MIYFIRVECDYEQSFQSVAMYISEYKSLSGKYNKKIDRLFQKRKERKTLLNLKL